MVSCRPLFTRYLMLQCEMMCFPMFRRSCFEAIGGLLPLPEGGWDVLACAVARMHGFETRLVTTLVVDHLKPRNVSQGAPLRRLWQLGVRDYAVGYHPVFELVKCATRLKERPIGFASCARWLGFCAAQLSRRPRITPSEIVRFIRREQAARLRRAVGWERRSGTGAAGTTYSSATGPESGSV